MKLINLETGKQIDFHPVKKKIEVYEEEYNAIKAQSAYYYNENKKLRSLLIRMLQVIEEPKEKFNA